MTSRNPFQPKRLYFKNLLFDLPMILFQKLSFSGFCVRFITLNHVFQNSSSPVHTVSLHPVLYTEMYITLIFLPLELLPFVLLCFLHNQGTCFQHQKHFALLSLLELKKPKPSSIFLLMIQG